MKGQTELAIIAIMMFVGVLAIFLPVILYKETSIINIEYEYHYDNSEALLLSLMPITVTDSLTHTSKPLIELLGEYIQLPQNGKPDITQIKTELSKLANGINTNCYELSASSPTLSTTSTSKTSTRSSSSTSTSYTSTSPSIDIVPGSCTKYSAPATIPLPYMPGNLVKIMTLVIEK